MYENAEKRVKHLVWEAAMRIKEIFTFCTMFAEPTLCARCCSRFRELSSDLKAYKSLLLGSSQVMGETDSK